MVEELVATTLDGAVRNQATRQAGDSAHAQRDPSCSVWALTIAIRLEVCKVIRQAIEGGGGRVVPSHPHPSPQGGGGGAGGER